MQAKTGLNLLTCTQVFALYQAAFLILFSFFFPVIFSENLFNKEAVIKESTASVIFSSIIVLGIFVYCNHRFNLKHPGIYTRYICAASFISSVGITSMLYLMLGATNQNRNAILAMITCFQVIALMVFSLKDNWPKFWTQENIIGVIGLSVCFLFTIAGIAGMFKFISIFTAPVNVD